MKSRAILVSALCLTASCGHEAPYPTTTSADVHYVVHAMLGAGVGQQRIVLERSRALGEGYFLGLTPVSGAEITITADDGTVVTAAEIAASPGTYESFLVPQSGREYTLRVSGPEGTLVGVTRVPDPPAIVQPSVDTTMRPIDQTVLAWTRPANAEAFVIVVATPGTPEPEGFVGGRQPIADTSRTIGFFFSPTGDLHVRVGAVDANYASYIAPNTNVDGNRRPVRTTVAGGYGLFGSYALSQTRVIRRE